jgi:hypothetical protein
MLPFLSWLACGSWSGSRCWAGWAAAVTLRQGRSVRQLTGTQPPMGEPQSMFPGLPPHGPRPVSAVTENDDESKKDRYSGSLLHERRPDYSLSVGRDEPAFAGARAGIERAMRLLQTSC